MRFLTTDVKLTNWHQLTSLKLDLATVKVKKCECKKVRNKIMWILLLKITDLCRISLWELAINWPQLFILAFFYTRKVLNKSDFQSSFAAYLIYGEMYISLFSLCHSPNFLEPKLLINRRCILECSRTFLEIFVAIWSKKL